MIERFSWRHPGVDGASLEIPEAGPEPNMQKVNPIPMNRERLHQPGASDGWVDHLAPQVHLVGAVTHQPEWQDPQRVIYDHELMLMGEGGRFRYEFEDESMECVGPAFILIPPGRWHRCQGCSQPQTVRAWVHFDWTPGGALDQTPILTYWPGPPRAQLYRPAPSFVPPLPLMGQIEDPGPVFEMHARLRERFENPQARIRLTSRAVLLELLLHLLSSEFAEAHRGNRSRAERIRERLDQLARVPFREAEQVRPFLAALGQSYDHQARLFREAFGVTPLRYLNIQRMERARQLLLDRSRTVAEVAEELGFSDLIYFHRLFKQIAGQTPHRFRIGKNGRDRI